MPCFRKVNWFNPISEVKGKKPHGLEFLVKSKFKMRERWDVTIQILKSREAALIGSTIFNDKGESLELLRAVT